MAAPKQPDETDSLSSLEERITRAVDLVMQLRLEKASLEAELDRVTAERDEARLAANTAKVDAATAQDELNAVRSKTQHSSQELDELRAERKHVRARIEKLLNQMDLLSGT